MIQISNEEAIIDSSLIVIPKTCHTCFIIRISSSCTFMWHHILEHASDSVAASMEFNCNMEYNLVYLLGMGRSI